MALPDLIACWTNPSRFYLERTLGVHLARDEEPIDDCEPMTVGGLEKYLINDRILKNHLGGRRSAERDREAAMAGGALPSGELAGHWIDRLNDDLATLLAHVGRPAFQQPATIDLRGESWRPPSVGRVDGTTETRPAAGSGPPPARPATSWAPGSRTSRCRRRAGRVNRG